LPQTVVSPRAHHDRQQVDRVIAGERYAGHGFVFATPTGEPLEGTAVYKYLWRPTLKRLGCRRFGSTISGTPPRHRGLKRGCRSNWCRNFWGHASMAITADVYARILPAYRREAATVLAAHLEGAR
jgi:hypothetical protein